MPNYEIISDLIPQLNFICTLIFEIDQNKDIDGICLKYNVSQKVSLI